MKNRYRLFLRRRSVYYAFDNTTKTFESLKTKDKAEAARLLMALTLHSYRYAWAERALKCGYPERFAQQALGHNSKAAHHTYSKHA